MYSIFPSSTSCIFTITCVATDGFLYNAWKDSLLPPSRPKGLPAIEIHHHHHRRRRWIKPTQVACRWRLFIAQYAYYDVYWYIVELYSIYDSAIAVYYIIHLPARMHRMCIKHAIYIWYCICVPVFYLIYNPCYIFLFTENGEECAREWKKKKKDSERKLYTPRTLYTRSFFYSVVIFGAKHRSRVIYFFSLPGRLSTRVESRSSDGGILS